MIVISTDPGPDNEWLGVDWSFTGSYYFGRQARGAFNLMQVPVGILAAALAVTNVYKIVSTGGAPLGLIERFCQHITQRHYAVPRRLVAMPLRGETRQRRKWIRASIDNGRAGPISTAYAGLA